MKSISTFGLTAAMVLCIASLACAAETNFGPSNMSGNAPAAESKKIRPAESAAKSTEPGFWEKEAKRSGLAGTGDGFKKKVGGIFGAPDFFKKQSEAYKARNAGTDK